MKLRFKLFGNRNKTEDKLTEMLKDGGAFSVLMERMVEIQRKTVYPSDEFHDKYLFDFKKGYLSGSSNNEAIPVMSEEPSHFIKHDSDFQNFKIAIKPIDVLQELETVPTPFTLELLEEKLTVLRDKERLIIQSYSKREVTALIERLENRKKYNEYAEFYSQFANTTDEKIDKLLGKYDLVMKEADLFIPEFPDTAINIMSKYTAMVLELCGKEPIYWVIAQPELFKERYKQRDPILLVQSPFGFYWQILGAWDKEMLILSEL
jgi:hypothetical protein